MKFKLLDCTLRDGGYYNNWFFARELVDDYLSSMKNQMIDSVEIGFRSLKTNTSRGPYYFSSNFLGQLHDLRAMRSVSIMINASELIESGVASKEKLNKLLPNLQKEDVADTVRIACHFEEVRAVMPLLNEIKKKGFRVFLNLMQITEHSLTDIEKLCRCLRKEPIDIFYFADSLGSLTGAQICTIVRVLKGTLDIPLGFHAHDNMRLALSNCLASVSEGVEWVDATMRGMGRGPGNACTEELLIHKDGFDPFSRDYRRLCEVNERHFDSLKKLHGWGTNNYYYLAANHSIHPTYIQTIESNNEYETSEKLGLIKELSTRPSSKYSLKNLRIKGGGRSTDATKNKVLNQLKNRDVLLVGAGDSIKRHAEGITKFIEIYKPIVCQVNGRETGLDIKSDIKFFLNPLRSFCDVKDSLDDKATLVMPTKMLNDELMLVLEKSRVVNFEVSFDEELLGYENEKVIVPNNLSLSFALAILIKSKAKRILVAGFDGYGETRRNQQTHNSFDLALKNKECPELRCLLDTEYGLSMLPLYSTI